MRQATDLVLRAATEHTAAALRDHVARRLSFALRRCEHHVHGVTVRLADLNGPKRGVDSHDYDAHYPPAARALKDAIASVDAVLFVTPEYNRSIPGGLKNAIDWASRPYGKNSFTRKPSGVIGTSPGKIGTAVGQQHLRSILAFCNSPLMNSIEAYLQFTPGLINDDGEVTDDSVAEFLRNYMAEFYGFITRVYTVLPRSA
jgi:chromate reductase